MRKRLLSLFFLCLVPALGLTACDSGGSSGGEINNEFSLDVTPKGSSEGATAQALRDKTLEGFAFFYSGQKPNGEDAFGIYLSGSDSFDSPQEGLFGFLGALNTTRLGTGEYSVIEPEQGLSSGSFGGVFYEDLGGDFRNAPFHIPQEGTVELTTSNESEVSGTVTIPTAFSITYDLTATPPTIDTTEVQITGSFTAESVDSFAEFSTP